MTEESPKRPRWATVVLVVLPLWLIVSGVFAMWFYFRQERANDQLEQERFATSVSGPMLEDDLRKLVEIIGERHGSSESASKNLSRAAAMIEGLLGPSNTGYTINRIVGPAAWPLIQVTLRGKNADYAPIWVVSSYDSHPGSPGVEANATGLAATLAAAQAMAADKPEASVHFLFFPHANDPDSPVMEMLAKFKDLANGAASVLCVEAMGAGESIWLTSRDAEALPLSRIQGLGMVRGAEVVCLGDDTDLASLMFEMGLPAARVGTRPMVNAAEPDDKLPPVEILAASTGRLIELIRRCASAR
jgi:hypothetical protein